MRVYGERARQRATTPLALTSSCLVSGAQPTVIADGEAPVRSLLSAGRRRIAPENLRRQQPSADGHQDQARQYLPHLRRNHAVSDDQAAKQGKRKAADLLHQIRHRSLAPYAAARPLVSSAARSSSSCFFESEVLRTRGLYFSISGKTLSAVDFLTRKNKAEVPFGMVPPRFLMNSSLMP